MGSTRRSAPWLGSAAAHVAVGAIWLATRSPAPAPDEVVHDPIIVDVIDPIEAPATTVTFVGGVPLPPAPDRPPARRRAAPVPRSEAPIVRAAPTPAPKTPVDPPRPELPAVATSPIPAHAATDAPGSATASAPIAPPGAAGTRTSPAAVRVVAHAPTGAPAVIEHADAGPRLHPRSPRLISNAARPVGSGGVAVEARVFVAILTIDTDGTVIGAKLKRGPPGHRTDRAMAAVWRFRYHPAVDGDGQPIVSRVEQRFVVE